VEDREDFLNDWHYGEKWWEVGSGKWDGKLGVGSGKWEAPSYVVIGRMPYSIGVSLFGETLYKVVSGSASLSVFQ